MLALGGGWQGEVGELHPEALGSLCALGRVGCSLWVRLDAGTLRPVGAQGSVLAALMQSVGTGLLCQPGPGQHHHPRWICVCRDVQSVGYFPLSIYGAATNAVNGLDFTRGLYLTVKSFLCLGSLIFCFFSSSVFFSSSFFFLSPVGAVSTAGISVLLSVGWRSSAAARGGHCRAMRVGVLQLLAALGPSLLLLRAAVAFCPWLFVRGSVLLRAAPAEPCPSPAHGAQVAMRAMALGPPLRERWMETLWLLFHGKWVLGRGG